MMPVQVGVSMRPVRKLKHARGLPGHMRQHPLRTLPTYGTKTLPDLVMGTNSHSFAESHRSRSPSQVKVTRWIWPLNLVHST